MQGQCTEGRLGLRRVVLTSVNTVGSSAPPMRRPRVGTEVRGHPASHPGQDQGHVPGHCSSQHPVQRPTSSRQAGWGSGYSRGPPHLSPPRPPVPRVKDPMAAGEDCGHIRFFSFSLIEGYISLVMDVQTQQR